MKFLPAGLPGAFIVEPEPYADTRGWFARMYCRKEFASIGYDMEWVQMNQSYTKQEGSIRGLHFQLPPYQEIKLVRCIVGRVWDVIVDVRQDSPGFLKWVGLELSAANKRALYIPAGFAHGFQTLTDDCEMLYCHSMEYIPGYESGIRFDDPAVGVDWQLPMTMISDKDKRLPLLTDQFKGIKI
ncbi:MAG: dTDP-4-dehydrorhamnose 3,5-epimerase [Sphingobacteriales bacterium 50-39]|nr:dTDP-4-dehydrorhamnose 3,5-epimerase [Sphingobacteriales bacterium]OJW53745.1 MAG: dTDP-4-dehydrorhamnose 3,5-epimerase [Sphingobacteriales bacterium 50-39]